MRATLLIELLTEELPPTSLLALSNSFGDLITQELKRRQFVATETTPILFATPRRLAVLLPGVCAVAPDQAIVRKGPAVSAAVQQGQPTAALTGFARSCKVPIDELLILNDGKQLIYAYQSTKSGERLFMLLPGILAQVLKQLPIPKLMRWGSAEHYFVRPVHGVTIMHGQQLIDATVLGIKSSHSTRGHRFLSEGPLVLTEADSYARVLFEQGKVVASFAARRALIERCLRQAAKRLSATIAANDALITEVTALVEWPVVLEGRFKADFLTVPQECLILTMQQHQRYFPLLDACDRLMSRFLLVANLETPQSHHIIQGNERVLHARLSDAKFFFEQDQKVSLADRLPQLANVVYHSEIGSQLARSKRLVYIATAIAQQLSVDGALAARAAYLAKADLVSAMVSEFPELQGTMGMYYARLDGEAEAVAAAIGAHYRPRFSGDSLPDSPIAVTVALADKLETLVGIWGIGLKPTSDKDPFALRRAALGVLRMLATVPLDLKELLELTVQSFDSIKLSTAVVEEVLAFSLDRLKHFLVSNYSVDVVEAVLALSPSRFDHLDTRLAAVTAFKASPESSAVLGANKRVQNLLKQAESQRGIVDVALLQHEAEQQLFDAVRVITPQLDNKFAEHDYIGVLAQLAGLKQPVDAFLEGILVLTSERAMRANRLALLGCVWALFNRVADMSLLADTLDAVEK